MMPETTGNFDPMKRIFFIFCAFCFSFPLKAEDGLASHQAVYDIALASTAGGAASVVNAKGKMLYKIQKVCGQWQTESVFSLDIGYELSGPDTTNWKAPTGACLILKFLSGKKAKTVKIWRVRPFVKTVKRCCV